MGFLRFLLAVDVVLIHSIGIQFTPLNNLEAVQSFYLISGFYMALILNEKYIGEGSYRLFITNRFLRIFPIYWAVLILTAAGWGIVYWLQDNSGPFLAFTYGNPLSCTLITLSNLFIFGQDYLMFTGITPQGQLFLTTDFRVSTPMVMDFLFAPQAWSLGLELIFYLLAPFLVRRSVKAIGCIILVSAALRAYLMIGLGLRHDPWNYRFFPTELAFFLAGALMYHAYRRLRARGGKSPLAVPMALLVFAVFFLHPLIPAWPSAGIKRLGFYALVAAALPYLFALTKNNRFDRYVGELSYPIYISHWLVLTFLPMALKALHVRSGHAIGVVIVTIALSMLLNRLIADPLENQRQQRVRKAQEARHPQPSPPLIAELAAIATSSTNTPGPRG